MSNKDFFLSSPHVCYVKEQRRLVDRHKKNTEGKVDFFLLNFCSLTIEIHRVKERNFMTVDHTYRKECVSDGFTTIERLVKIGERKTKI